jgi:tetratricopeptide (TPR) repeat protein
MRNFARRLAQVAFITLLAAGVATTTSCGKKTPEQRLEEARKLLQEKQVPLAVLKLKDIIKDHGDEDAGIEARFGLAAIYTQLRRDENLANARDLYLEIYKKLGIKDERGFAAHRQAIELHMALGAFDKALELVDDGIAKAADDPEQQTQIRTLRAVMLLAGGTDEQKEEAKTYLHTQMVNDDADPVLRGQSRELLAKYLRDKGKYDESSAVYDEWLAKYPDDSVNPMLVITKAINSQLAGRPEEAAALLDAGEKSLLAAVEAELNMERKSQMLNDLAQLMAAARAFDRAEAAFRRIMALQPATQTALNAQFQIAEMYLRNRMPDQAQATLEAIARENANTQIAEMAQGGLRMVEQLRAQMAAQETSPTLTATPAAP